MPADARGDRAIDAGDRHQPARRDVAYNPQRDLAVAKLTAFALLLDMPELGRLGATEAGALAGLAPVARQSGRWTGRAFIRGGRASVRGALFMPALVMVRFNPDIKACHDRLRDAGKPVKVTLTAVMRKPIVLANALLRDNRTWAVNQH